MRILTKLLRKHLSSEIKWNRCMARWRQEKMLMPPLRSPDDEAVNEFETCAIVHKLDRLAPIGYSYGFNLQQLKFKNSTDSLLKIVKNASVCIVITFYRTKKPLLCSMNFSNVYSRKYLTFRKGFVSSYLCSN